AAALNYARNETEARQILARLPRHDLDADLDETMSFWREWSAQCQYNGPYQEVILRSALALKLCTFEPTGAIVAAPTTSLPEDIGGVRNWDYRYTWLRDSAFTLGALGELGYYNEARDYFHFLHDLQIRDARDLRIMYSIRGETDGALDEQDLTHLEGYQGSRPVRIGNGAATQRQMDVYGELADAAFSYVRMSGYRHPHRLNESLRDLRHLTEMLANYVADHWQDEDRGIWEVRGAPRAFVYSRAMCWVALDRACRLADHHGHQKWQEHWSKVRELIHNDIATHGYSDQLQSFTQSYGDETLDAANLRMSLTRYLSADNPRMSSTITVTDRLLSGDHGLLYRYRPSGANKGDGKSDGKGGAGSSDDGLPGSEGAFLACTYWYVSNLCLQGRLGEARERFEQLLQYANPLGLFSEEIDPKSGALLGNYPQAFTHIGLINSAVLLQRAQEGRMEPITDGDMGHENVTTHPSHE
ncbi:MAG: glycoside hydrolase family 15 protein, partial [Ktedonobacterales bacterium]